MIAIFHEPFMQTATLTGLLSVWLCSLVGVFLLLRRTVFIGIALSEVAALGVAVGLFLGLSPLVTALFFVFLTMVLFSFPLREKNTSREGLVGLTYAFCAALAVILIAKNPLAEAKGLNLISGNLIYSSWTDVRDLTLVAAIVLGVFGTFFKELIFVSFDRTTATTCGFKTQVWDIFYYTMVGLIFSLTVRICGVIFVFASLIIPAMVGLIFAKKTKHIFIIAFIGGSVCVLCGMILSFLFDFPSSPTIVVLYALLFILTAVCQSILNR